MKIVGLRYHYFTVPWNVFDFLLVLASILGILMEDIMIDLPISPTLLRVVRVFRIGRILRLIKVSIQSFTSNKLHPEWFSGQALYGNTYMIDSIGNSIFYPPRLHCLVFIISNYIKTQKLKNQSSNNDSIFPLLTIDSLTFRPLKALENCCLR